jgi:hypothetical protein
MSIAQTLRDSIYPECGENFRCVAAGLLHRHDKGLEQVAAWLKDHAGVESLGSFQHGTSALVFNLNERERGDFQKVARIAPYGRAKWSTTQNRPWSPLSLQPLARTDFVIDSKHDQFDSLSIEIMPKLNTRTASDIPHGILSDSGLIIFNNYDVGLLRENVPVFVDADAVNIGSNSTKPYAWLNPAWRQAHMKKIHENQKKHDLGERWVVERDGTYFSQQQLLSGDYLSGRPTEKLRVRVAAHHAKG